METTFHEGEAGHQVGDHTKSQFVISLLNAGPDCVGKRNEKECDSLEKGISHSGLTPFRSKQFSQKIVADG